MSGYVVALVLFAAALHAGWNAIAKHIPSRLAASTLIGLAYLVGGAVGLILLPLPATGVVAVPGGVGGPADRVPDPAHQLLRTR